MTVHNIEQQSQSNSEDENHSCFLLRINRSVFSQAELNALVRDLYLSKEPSELLSSN